MAQRILMCAAAVLLAASGGLFAQQHSYAPADIEAGRDLYQGSCSGCHGQAGDAIQGADLSTGRFRHGGSDEDLIRIIRNGIADTAMPPHEFLSVGEARTIVAFLRSLPAGGATTPADAREVRLGDPDRGQAIFEGRGECTGCHSVNGDGGLIGPDLGGIGGRRAPAEIEMSILEPDAEVRAGNRFYRVVDENGRTVTGRLLNQDTHSVQMMSTDEELVSFMKRDLEEYGFIDSPMPSYRDELSEDELADLVAYLVSLQGENAR